MPEKKDLSDRVGDGRKVAGIRNLDAERLEAEHKKIKAERDEQRRREQEEQA